MENLLDQDAIGNQDFLVVYTAQINTPLYNQKLRLGLLGRGALLTLAVVLFALAWAKIAPHREKLQNYWISLQEALERNIAVFIFCLTALVIAIGVIVVFLYVLNETLQVSRDYLSKKVCCYETSIEEKIFIPDADAQYRIRLKHEVDNKSEYKVKAEQYHLFKKGDKVKIILSAYGKIFLSVEAG